MTVTYHDPCELGRHCGVYEPPRDVLKLIPGLKFRELPKSSFLTHCCGGGGLIKITNHDIALKLSLKKLDEARSVGAENIVSSCPTCLLNVSEAIDECNSSIEMLDITEVVAKALGLDIRI